MYPEWEAAEMTEESTPGSRLRQAREEAGYESAARAAEALGMRSSTYAGHENGQNKFDAEQARVYGKKLKVSPVWLLFGDEFSPPKVTKKRLIETFDPDAAEELPASEEMYVSSEFGARGIPSGTVPQIDVTAGMGGGGLTLIQEGVAGHSGMTFAAEAVRDFWRFPLALLQAAGVNPEDLAILPSQGDSMSPTILDGEFVVVNTRHRLPSPDGIYALSDAFGGVVVKRLELTSKPTDEIQTVRIISDNPKHAPREWNLEEVRVIGLVLWRFGRIN